MEISKIESIVEGILFASGEPVSFDRIQSSINIDAKTLKLVIENMAKNYDENNRGIMLLQLDNKLQLCSRPAYADYIRSAIEIRKQPVLSQASLEVLAIAAYRQPVTRSLIEQIRGVDSSGTVNLLVEKGLLEECGKLDVPGRPTLFKTTSAFLRVFGIKNLSQLPDLPEPLQGDYDNNLGV